MPKKNGFGMVGRLTGVSHINSAVAQLDTITQQTAALAEAQQHAEINHRSEAD